MTFLILAYRWLFPNCFLHFASGCRFHCTLLQSSAVIGCVWNGGIAAKRVGSGDDYVKSRID